MYLDRTTLPQFDEWKLTSTTDGGVALIDKSTNWTSFDVVAKLRGLTRIKKVGHAGTLDPLASGLLILCFGKFTKKISEFQNAPKQYEAVIKLEATTKTDDSEAPEENHTSTLSLTNEQITNACHQFIGVIDQIPPMYSAIKKDGQPLYKLARKGIELDLPPRKVTIYSIVITKIELPFIHLTIDCAKGTYIRSLARDIGALLGCGGYLAALRRTAIGDFRVENAVTVQEIMEQVQVLNLH
ncbi:MAG: tRNA pseudouridine(55) synthase TruB [Ignavibacteria bacterium]|nr:tRNA pseudouridine(55) synthase TruB [Ignavibacteria bacterium]